MEQICAYHTLFVEEVQTTVKHCIQFPAANWMNFINFIKQQTVPPRPTLTIECARTSHRSAQCIQDTEHMALSMTE
jgi:hypothetical protein